MFYINKYTEKGQEAISIAQKLADSHECRIVFQYAVFPGVIVKINDRNTAIKLKIEGPKSLTLVKGKIFTT